MFIDLFTSILGKVVPSGMYFKWCRAVDSSLQISLLRITAKGLCA